MRCSKQSRPYADALAADAAGSAGAAVGTVDHPYMKPGTAGAPAGVDPDDRRQGTRRLVQREPHSRRRDHAARRRQPQVVSGRQQGAQRRAPAAARRRSQSWPLQSPDKLAAAREIAAQVSDDFVAGRIGSVQLISPKLVNMMSQRPETRQLLPVAGGRSGAGRRRPAQRGRVRALARGRALAHPAEVSGIHDLRGDARDRCVVLRRPAGRDEQRQRQRQETDRSADGADEQCPSGRRSPRKSSRSSAAPKRCPASKESRSMTATVQPQRIHSHRDRQGRSGARQRRRRRVHRRHAAEHQRRAASARRKRRQLVGDVDQRRRRSSSAVPRCSRATSCSKCRANSATTRCAASRWVRPTASCAARR